MYHELSERVERAFQEHFHTTPPHLVYAPGRVNLIGEHTDYNEGWVLPCAIRYGTVLAARPRSDGLLNAIALDYEGEQASIVLQQPLDPGVGPTWFEYLKGVVHVFLSEGYSLSGFDLVLGGDIPRGAGLSSSASLQVALGYLIAELNAIDISKVEVARYAQRAENEFVGCQCGIMDQLASALGEPQHALLIDCQSQAVELLPIPDQWTLLIVDSRVQRGLVESAYNERRAQCEEGARALGLKSLRGATLADLQRGDLTEEVERRARHVITENQRVLKARALFQDTGFQPSVWGDLLRASHASLKADFEVTTPEVDLLVHLLNEVIGSHGGARMTGGGFGGCVVAMSSSPLSSAQVRSVIERYKSETGLDARVYRGDLGGGVRSVRTSQR